MSMEDTHTYIAHSVNSNGILQTMNEHCSGVGKIMRGFALDKSFADLYEFCGIIHDMGKYSDDFQRYIAGDNIKTKHSIYGALYASENKHIELSLPVFGHHAGLPNSPEMRLQLKAEFTCEKEKYNCICKRWLSDIGNQFCLPNNENFLGLSNVLMQELFVRMLYSSLVDADSLDTERHFDTEKFKTRTSPSFDAQLLLNRLQQTLDSLKANSENSGINQLRNNVRKYAESKASMSQGFFSLTLPTGLGKTICSINWALHHAQCHDNIKRIIIVLPFISIIDQTAEVLKNIFDDDNCCYVLEHHSNVNYLENENEDKYDSKLLATENWDYPIIVTTNVQFFESLFSNKRSSCRKLHNIQDSIIIFDEIQTLPLGITEPTLTMLENLQQVCRCSMLFCTATQPDFESRDGFSGIKHIESLVENPLLVFEQTRRVTYHPINDYKEIAISELSDMVAKNHQSSLVVFNTKKKARLFFEEMKDCSQYRLFHLSTSMCPAHRKKVIKEIRNALLLGEYIVVSSTQLIEAGVDMDFPIVYRELAPLESIIQSAGRCNREGKMRDENGSEKKGVVYLFSLTESGQPSRQYRSWSEFANLLYKGNEEKLYTHDFYSYYYRELISNFANTDKLSITNDRKKLLYQTVAEKYKIIDDKTQSIFIFNYNEESLELYNCIKNREFLTRQERQLVSQYSVQVYDKFLKENKSFVNMEKCSILVWYGSYSEDFGLPFIQDFSTIII